MMKRMLVFLIVVIALIAVPLAFSQMEQGQPPIYTYVSQFNVPRANWAQYTADEDKSFLPIANKMLADGTIVSYSTFENMVHTVDGYSNGASWSSPTISGLMKMLEELRKAGPRPGQVASTKHEDYLMVSTMYGFNPSDKSTSGYLRVVCQNAKPEHPEEYGKAMKKYLWPAFEEQLKSGSVSFVSLDAQYVNTSAPSTRCLVIDYPNAEGMDKWAKAIGEILAKESSEREAFLGAVVPDSRRDILARVTHKGHK